MQKTECRMDHPFNIVRLIVLMVIALLCVPSRISAQQGFDASIIAEKLVEADEDELTRLYSELHEELVSMEKDQSIANVDLLMHLSNFFGLCMHWLKDFFVRKIEITW